VAGECELCGSVCDHEEWDQFGTCETCDEPDVGPHFWEADTVAEARGDK
jgi:hypothetical protein